MRRATLILTLLVLVASISVLSALSNILTGYPKRPQPGEPEKIPTEGGTSEEPPSLLLFKVSPATPQLYWRTSSADYYTGQKWLKTTLDEALELPQVQEANATRVFTVEIDARQREFFLPLASPHSTLGNISLSSPGVLRFFIDTVGNVYKVRNLGQMNEVSIAYRVSWSDFELDDRLISRDDTPVEILDKYLQLPDIPFEVWKLAQDLESSSYSVLDQILADVQYLRTNFVYDAERWQSLKASVVFEAQSSDVLSYINRKKGLCLDAATALAVILRIQGIPARMSFGFKPGDTVSDKLLYYTTGAHALTEVYLPPYGWVQFDATPPLEYNPLVKVLPFKGESPPGSRLLYQLSITDRRNSTDHLRVLVNSKQKWSVVAAPRELRIQALQTVDALLEVTVPEGTSLGEKDILTVTVTSLDDPEVGFSILAIVQVANVPRVPTTTTTNIDNAVIRGETFSVKGMVLTASDERVDNMTIYVFLTKGTESEGVIVGKGFSEQGDFQIESLAPRFMDVGDFKAISISVGTTDYASSRGESILRVRATTSLKLSSQEEYLLRYGIIPGSLLWDNGTGFADAPISLRMTSLATPPEFWELEKLTFKNGTFGIETTFENPGAYQVKAAFLGNEFALGSNATQIVELKQGLPAIQIFGGNIAIRGEAFNITGTVQFENIGVSGETLTLVFDDKPLATIETRENGSYTWTLIVNSAERLGLHTLTVDLEKGHVTAIQEVIVKSKTTITTKVSHVASGMFLSFSASLSDDQGKPIQGEEIVIDNYGLSWKTDEKGNVTLLLDTAKLWPGNLMFTARFKGSELYLPTTTREEVALEPLTSLPFLIPLVSSPLIVVALAYAKHHLGRRQTSQPINVLEVKKEGVVEEETKPLQIVFLDIEAPFPSVWGVNDKLRIEITLDQRALQETRMGEVKVLIDEEVAASVRLSQQGHAELSHTFIKMGEHKVQAILPRTPGQPLSAEVKLRVVDYREEIIRLYNELLRKLDSYDIEARSEMTAREIESLILRMSAFDAGALRKVTACFEKAEYSNHFTARRDYETMYLSLKELNADVEKEE